MDGRSARVLQLLSMGHDPNWFTKDPHESLLQHTTTTLLLTYSNYLKHRLASYRLSLRLIYVFLSSISWVLMSLCSRLVYFRRGFLIIPHNSWKSTMIQLLHDFQRKLQVIYLSWATMALIISRMYWDLFDPRERNPSEMESICATAHNRTQRPHSLRLGWAATAWYWTPAFARTAFGRSLCTKLLRKP